MAFGSCPVSAPPPEEPSRPRCHHQPLPPSLRAPHLGWAAGVAKRDKKLNFRSPRYVPAYHWPSQPCWQVANRTCILPRWKLRLQIIRQKLAPGEQARSKELGSESRALGPHIPHPGPAASSEVKCRHPELRDGKPRSGPGSAKLTE